MKQTKMSVTWGLFLVVVLCFSLQVKAQKVPHLNKSNVKQVIAAMTLEEKARLVVGTGMFFEIPDSMLKRMGGRNPFAPAPGSDTTYNSMIKKVSSFVPGAAGTTAELLRPGISSMVVSDGPAGVRISPTRKNDSNTYYCTAFPVGSLLASTWDNELVYKLGQSYGNEVKEMGIDVLLGPGMNIQRNPLCGRNFEYYSEDPLVSGKIAASMVNGIQSQGVGTSIKHFAVNNQETNRNSVNTILSERALREIYLEGFRIAVQEAQPWTVMSSYNKINGTYASESADLLTNILRNDWGFKGYVMTDWGGGSDAVAQMKAGNDLLMPGSVNQCKTIIDAVKNGSLDVKLLDRNVEKILNVLVIAPRFNQYKYSGKPDLKAHAAMTRMMASEGMILLKNEKAALPLSKTTHNLAVLGNASYDIIVGGTGSGQVNKAYTIPLAEGLKNGGYKIDGALQDTYQLYIKKAKDSQPKGDFFMMSPKPIDEMAITPEMASKLAGTTDAAIITIGRNAGEGADRKVENDFNLTDLEKSNLKIVSQAFMAAGKKTIVVLNIGGVIETSSWKELPDAILLAWQPGQEAGNSITDLLSGKKNPSGKLTVSFPVNYSDVPSSKNFPGIELAPEKGVKQDGPPDGFGPPRDSTKKGGRQEGPPEGFGRSRPSEVIYEEGIYVGYRYYNTFGVKTSYEFGYGLSYTTFDYSNLKLSSTTFNDAVTVTVDIKNTGSAAGREVAQLYLTAPSKNLDKPSSELKGYAKTRLLQPGESQTLSFTITAHNLASFDPSQSAWVADAGKYSVKLGASSTDIRKAITFDLSKDIIVKTESRSLIPAKKIAELKFKSK